MNQQQFFPVTEKSQVGEARRRVGEVTEQLGFDSTLRERAAIVVTELATNLLKHGGGGELVVRNLAPAETLGGGAGIEILALDRGPGMTNVAACLRDGYSTTGSLGQGLGAIQRQSHAFDLYSAPGQGTALLAQLWATATGAPAPPATARLNSPNAAPPTPLPPSFVYGAICRPKPGEEANGDGWHLHAMRGRCTLLLCDGLGHGPDAAAVTQRALAVFAAESTRSAVGQVEAIHQALQGTRGAAIAVATVGGESVDFVGIGNISGRVWLDDEARHLLSQHGIAGHQARKLQAFPQRWGKGGLLLLHSDGLGTRWTLESYPALRHRHPSLIAGVLYRDCTRGKDDVTVVVIKEKEESVVA
jgi:anti-sigma regulatory factor (Ser/Thr protein kinase)